MSKTAKKSVVLCVIVSAVILLLITVSYNLDIKSETGEEEYTDD